MRFPIQGRCVCLGLLQAVVLAGNVVAHPIADDDVTLPAEAGQGQAPLGDGPASPSLRLPAVAGEREAWSASLAKGGRFGLATDPSPRGDREGQVPVFAQARSGESGQPPATGFDDSDPLSGGLRDLLDTPRQTKAGRFSSRSARSGGEAESELGDEITAVIQDLQSSLVAGVTDALEIRVGQDGRVSFALAGADGFFVSPDRREGVSFGYGNTSLSIVAYGATNPDEEYDDDLLPPIALSRARHEREPRQFNATAELIEFVGEVFQHPLVWLLIFFLVIGKIAWMIAKYRNRRRRHRTRSRSQTTRVKLKPSRSRYKRLPATVTGPAAGSLQEP